ncbi:MAG: twitching motility protein PilT, partial [Gemmatimonadetes bacterium]|nr:twitching motility protein PilT [Gemmatimonadota bacterium]
MAAPARPHAARVRCYAELNDFLPARLRQREFEHTFDGSPAVKDLIESLGVPHPEVDLVLGNGTSVGFDHRVCAGDRIAVYPVFEALDVSPLQHLRPAPLRQPRFALDAHLGRLARSLRFLGFDCTWEPGGPDPDLIARSVAERRTILTRDRELLKHRAVTHGYWLRATDPRRQVLEVVDRFDLRRQARPFTRCSVCNGSLQPADAAE